MLLPAEAGGVTPEQAERIAAALEKIAALLELVVTGQSVAVAEEEEMRPAWEEPGS